MSASTPVSTDEATSISAHLQMWRNRCDPNRVPGFPAVIGHRTRKGGKGLTKAELAKLVGVSEGYYRKLERGVPGNYSPDILERLVRVLCLSPSERTHLYALVRNELPASPARPDVSAADPSLAALVHAQPWPAYTYGTDSWDITAFNQAAGRDYPWMLHGVNVMVWALAYPEARLQLCDWEESWCKPMASQLRLQYRASGSPRLAQVIAEITASDPRVGRLITDDLTTVAHADGHRRWLYRPGDQEPVEVEFLTLERRLRSSQRLMIVRPLSTT
ncbi:helix-turn-helix domain-containing protein [Streptomyces sp. NPDC002067]